MINAILALDENNGIGNKNSLPWPHIPEDMTWFEKCTKDSVVVMGSKTFESLGYQNLSNRWNIVLSTQPAVPSNSNATVSPSNMHDFLKHIDKAYEHDVWIIGGKAVYEQTLQYCDMVFVTRIHGKYECDTHLSLGKLLKYHYLFDERFGAECDFEIWSKNTNF